VLTLGVDLATEPRKTAACLISWPDDPGQRPQVDLLRTNVTDDDILALADGATVVAIDAPFGWPRAWAAAVGAHRPGAAFAAEGSPASLTRRATDAWVAQTLGIYPLSVAANLIGATAIRCARLVRRLGRHVDTGVRPQPPFISEVYPAAALIRWGLSHRLYKGRQLRASRELLVAELVRAGLPVALSEGDRHSVESSDDALDALICALVARAIALGLTDDIPESLRTSGANEGWIRVPSPHASLLAIADTRA
jgi:predicted RNase H-like nuclease